MKTIRKVINFFKSPKVYRTLLASSVGAGLVASQLMTPKQVALTAFISALSAQQVSKIMDYGDTIRFTTLSNETFSANVGNLDKSQILERATKQGVEYDSYTPGHIEQAMYLIGGCMVTGFVLYLCQIFYNESSDRPLRHETNTKFENIAGCDEAKNSLQEVIDYFKNPDKYTAFGARLPRGVLIYGPPGTGKTLLAKATAGESNVNFISASGSEFIEVYIGVGPKRVRDLFQQARDNSPCILFIDEIESLATKRSLMENATNFESQATINQLLTEMDGFIRSDNVVVIGATNRQDLIDDAVLRPGRFDRKIEVNRPNMRDRFKIIKLNLNKRLTEVTDDCIQEIARNTKYFSGADLENLVNEACFECIRNKIPAITNEFLLNTFELINKRMKNFRINCVTRGLGNKDYLKTVYSSV